MNRFEYIQLHYSHLRNEEKLAEKIYVNVFDGEIQTPYRNGRLVLTPTKILWGNYESGYMSLSLDLGLVLQIEKEMPSAYYPSNSFKIIMYLSEKLDDKKVFNSNYNYIKFEFNDLLKPDIYSIIQTTLEQRASEDNRQPGSSEKNAYKTIKLRTGIVGIERTLQEKQIAADQSISEAFQDLSKLMGMANDMVKLSQHISAKIKDKKGDITEDETVRFKSYLLSLGIDDPVTRDSYKSNKQYYRSLAQEICNVLSDPIEKAGGMMGITDVYCRINRARGLELISPEDTLNACKFMETLQLPLKLYQFKSGVMVLQSTALCDENVAEDIAKRVKEKGSISCEELAEELGTSVILAKERFLMAENLGKCCRDAETS